MANTVLPARREAITLETADGLRLVGELAVPEEAPPVATLVMLHPLPTHGGMMDSHLFRKAAYRLPALADLAVLRFNTRGTASEAGRSEGEFGEGEAERLDVAAALDFVEYHDLPAPWLVGWSFGTDLALRYGCDPTVVGAVLISPPLRYSADATCGVGEPASRWSRSCRSSTTTSGRPRRGGGSRSYRRRQVDRRTGAKHLFVGYTETVLDAVVARSRPARSPLPRDWPDRPELSSLRGLDQLGEHAADALRVQERDRRAERAVPWPLVDQPEPVLAELASAASTSSTPYPMWCTPSPRAVEELPDRGVRRQRLEQLHVRRAARRVGDVQHRLLHALRLVGLATGNGQAERRLVELDARVEVAAGDADVVDARQKR